MSKVFAYWYQHDEGHGNFGDELNPYLIQKLSNSTVIWVNPNYLVNSRFLACKMFIHRVLMQKKGFKNIFDGPEWLSLVRKKIVIPIGSIISQYAEGRVVVWGSGLLQSDATIYNADFRAVRGRYTQDRIKKLGYRVPEVLGDPALLLPLVYPPSTEKKFKVGIIPHYVHFEQFQKEFEGSDVLVINLLEPIEKVIDLIVSCEITYSTSLHGVIVSHAYEVPSIWITHDVITNRLQLAGDNIKFKDYFSSVDIPEYEPINIQEILNAKESITPHSLKKIEDVLLPSSAKIKSIQKELVKCAPFPVDKDKISL